MSEQPIFEVCSRVKCLTAKNGSSHRQRADGEMSIISDKRKKRARKTMPWWWSGTIMVCVYMAAYRSDRMQVMASPHHTNKSMGLPVALSLTRWQKLSCSIFSPSSWNPNSIGPIFIARSTWCICSIQVEKKKLTKKCQIWQCRRATYVNGARYNCLRFRCPVEWWKSIFAVDFMQSMFNIVSWVRPTAHKRPPQY